MSGYKRVEQRRDGQWFIQPIQTGKSAKVYKCPGCNLEVSAGVAHLVAWRADDILGDDNALSARRHWHTHCWKVR